MINSVPYTISNPGAYTLGQNLTIQANTNAIQINASNVSVDLGGYTLAETAGGTSEGITVSSGLSNVTIQNGAITGFALDVVFGSGSGHSLTNVQLLNFSSIGLLVLANNCLIENCSMVGATGASATGIYIWVAGGVGVRNNLISECNNGIYENSVTTPNALIANYEANCTNGLYLSSGSKYQGNVTTGCTTPVTGGIAVGQENG